MPVDGNLLLVALSGALALNHLVGIDLLVGLTRRVDVALRLALAVVLAALVTVPLALAAERLLQALETPWLRVPLLAFSALAGAYAGALLLRLLAPRLAVALRDYFPLLTMNALLLGVALASAAPTSLAAGLATGAAHALGFAILVTVFGYVQQRLTTSAVPRAFRGAPITLISLGILALGFQAFGA